MLEAVIVTDKWNNDDMFDLTTKDSNVKSQCQSNWKS